MDDPDANVLSMFPHLPAAGARYEFSVRVTAAGVARSGRFGIWLAGDRSRPIEPMARWLEAIGAPQAVRTAQAEAPAPVRQGAAVGVGGNGIEYRLYLHGLDPTTRANTYLSWRWRPGPTPPRTDTYTFHFAPETAAGAQPSTLVPTWARDGVALVADMPRMRQLSGFWLRHSSTASLDQVDLALPWSPRAGDIEGVGRLLDQFDLVRDERKWIDTLPIRHVAIPAGANDTASTPTVTLYASARLASPPAEERALQAAVIAAAELDGRTLERRLAALPPQPTASVGRGAMDHFYSGEIARWRRALGPEMHYHNALFDRHMDNPDDAAMHAASRRAVTDLYPFIATGCSVYDLGCGWGGPLAMLARERGCRVLGATIARSQFRHIAAMGLPVRWADAERTLTPGYFDCILMLESFEHIQDKAKLLQLLRPFAQRLVMRVNCQDAAPASTSFGGSMPMISSTRLRQMLESAGWRVSHWRNRRSEAGPSIAAWRRRLALLPVSDDHHFETFRQWCDRVHRLGQSWADNNPLMEVVAD